MPDRRRRACEAAPTRRRLHRRPAPIAGRSSAIESNGLRHAARASGCACVSNTRVADLWELSMATLSASWLLLTLRPRIWVFNSSSTPSKCVETLFPERAEPFGPGDDLAQRRLSRAGTAGAVHRAREISPACEDEVLGRGQADATRLRLHPRASPLASLATWRGELRSAAPKVSGRGLPQLYSAMRYTVSISGATAAGCYAFRAINREISDILVRALDAAPARKLRR